jgi:hypothetical protein
MVALVVLQVADIKSVDGDVRTSYGEPKPAGRADVGVYWLQTVGAGVGVGVGVGVGWEGFARVCTSDGVRTRF